MIPVTYSTVPMTRNAKLTLSAAIFAVSGATLVVNRAWSDVLERDGGTGQIVRAAKLIVFDFPVAFYFVGLNHELGHATRAHENGIRTELHLATPWSARQYDIIPLDPGAGQSLPAQAGGLEADLRQKQVAERWMLQSDRVSPGHALAIIGSSVSLPLYAFWNLAPDRFGTDEGFPKGDVGEIVRIISDSAGHGGPSFETLRHRVRTRTALNFIDFGLWTQTAGMLRDYVWHGKEGVPVRWLTIGPVRLIPSLRYELSLIGPEYHVRSYFQVRGRAGVAYLRWTDRITGERQTGAGVSVSGWQLRRVRPAVDLDLWSQTTDGAGAHAAVGSRVAGWPSQRAEIEVSVGAKSSGYLAGHPLHSGAYLNAGFAVKLW